MTLRTALVATLASLAAAAAFAQTPAPSPAASTPRVDARQAHQAARIDQGVASGALTGREARRLEAQQAHIDRVETRVKSDGTVTKAEKARVHHELNQADRRIKVQKHDRQTAGSASGK